MFGGNSGHLWFLIALFWCFVIFYPLEKYVFRRNIFCGIIIICFLFNWNLSGLLGDISAINSVPGVAGALNYLPYFVCGGGIY